MGIRFSAPEIKGQPSSAWEQVRIAAKFEMGLNASLYFLEKLHLPNFIIEGMYINGSYYQPMFLYESIWCLIGFIILMTSLTPTLVSLMIIITKQHMKQLSIMTMFI